MTVYFTSDTHYGHRNIIKYAKRPFLTVEEMDSEMIRRWNSVVLPEDLVYHLGDFAFCPLERAIEIAKALNGTKHLIYGNHDKNLRREATFREQWASTQDFKEIKAKDPTADRGLRHIVLCHYALRVWNKSHHGSWSLFGHSHGTLPDDPGSRSVDVGVDCWNYTPVSIEQLTEVMAKKKFTPVDRHGYKED